MTQFGTAPAGAREADPGRDDILAAALAGGRSHAKAAEAAGCSRATVSRRLLDPAFRERVSEVRRAIFENIINSAVSGVFTSVKRLRRILEDDGRGDDHVAAARVMIDAMFRIQHQTEFADRLAALEAKAAKTNPNPDRSE